MTIAQLLSHHGHEEPRWVDVDGRVVFDAATATKPLIAMVQHTFHGGEDPEDRGISDEPWWTDDDAIQRHVVAVAKAFPSFHYLPAQDGGRPAFGGLINTGRGTFKVLVVLRHDRGLPSVSVIERRLGRAEGRAWRKPPHIYLSGNPCVADQGDWQPDQHTAAVAIAWAAHWLAAYTEWRFSGRWPVEGYVSNVA